MSTVAFVISIIAALGSSAFVIITGLYWKETTRSRKTADADDFVRAMLASPWH